VWKKVYERFDYCDVAPKMYQKYGTMRLNDIPHRPDPLIPRYNHSTPGICTACGKRCQLGIYVGKHTHIPICSKCVRIPSQCFGKQHIQSIQYEHEVLPLFAKKKPDPFTAAIMSTNGNTHREPRNRYLPPYTFVTRQMIVQAAKILYPYDLRITLKRFKPIINSITITHGNKGGRVCRLVAEGILVNPFATTKRMLRNIDRRILPRDLYERLHKPRYCEVNERNMAKRKEKSDLLVLTRFKKRQKKFVNPHNS